MIKCPCHPKDAACPDIPIGNPCVKIASEPKRTVKLRSDDADQASFRDHAYATRGRKTHASRASGPPRGSRQDSSWVLEQSPRVA